MQHSLDVISNRFTFFATVTVPVGICPGQTLLVQHPSGNGQVVSAVVPEGHHPGSTFYVSFPKLLVVKGEPVDNSNTKLPVTKRANQQANTTQKDDIASRAGNSNLIHTAGDTPARPKHQGTKKYKRCSEEMLLLHNKGLVKIKVPPNLKTGDRMKVQIADGRVINVVVPPGNMSEFYVKVPTKKQNFHDNPIAVVAPMALGPFVM